MTERNEIRDVLARDIWEFTGQDGRSISHAILVGHPVPDPDDPHEDWVCPVSIENFTSGITLVHGVGPVDALMNAMVLVKTLFDKIHNDGKPTTESNATSDESRRFALRSTR